MEYVSRWIKAAVLPMNGAKSVLKFLQKNIFIRFGTRRAIISDEGTLFYNRIFAAALTKYEIKYKVTIAYHPQTNSQAELSNKEIKGISKKVVNPNRKD